MEHIVQFAIGIDDEAIRKRIEEAAESQIIESIREDVEHTLFDRDRYSYKDEVDKNSPREWVKYMVREVIESNKDQIIKGAISELSRNLSKTKAVKDAMTKVVQQ